MVENRRSEPTPPAFGSPVGVILLEFRPDLWHQKTRVRGLLWRCLCDRTFSRFDTIPACDRRTDRQTDRGTHDDSIYHASI